MYRATEGINENIREAHQIVLAFPGLPVPVAWPHDGRAGNRTDTN